MRISVYEDRDVSFYAWPFAVMETYLRTWTWGINISRTILSIRFYSRSRVIIDTVVIFEYQQHPNFEKRPIFIYCKNIQKSLLDA